MVRASLIALGLAAVWQGEAPPLLENGGFEELVSPDRPEGWTATLYEGAARFGVDEEIVHGGERSAFVETMPGRRIGRYDFNWFQRLTLTPGERYELSGFVRCEARADTAFVIVQFWSNPSSRDQRLLGVSRASALVPLCSAEDWMDVHATLDVPEGTTSTFLRVGLMSITDGGRTDLGGKAWFDEISIAANRRP